MSAWDKIKRLVTGSAEPDPDGRDIHPATQLERVERILRDDAARQDMTCEETLAYFRRAGVHDVFGGDDE